MKVFISHKMEDAHVARNVHRILADGGVSAYLDTLDALDGVDVVNLADHLRRVLTGCDALLAIITKETAKSLWVPWEIGVATEKDMPLSSYVSGQVQIPEFLLKWPVLHSTQDLQLFRQRIRVLPDERMRRYGSKSQQERLHSSAIDFHRDLKQSLGQK